MKQAMTGILAALLVCGAECRLLAGSSADNVTSNTVAYWPFDAGSELVDASGNGHSLANTAVSFLQGSAIFDASQSSRLVTEAPLAFSAYTNLTIECFFQFPGYPPSSSYGFILTSASSYGTPGTLNLYQSATGVTADFFNTSGTYDQETSQLHYGVDVEKWHHAALVIDASKSGTDPDRLRFYVDRVRMWAASVNATDSTLSDNPLYIGSRGTQGFHFFNGKLDDIRITAAALAPDEFIAKRTRVANTNCIAYWPFNAGNELADASGNGHTLSNSQVVFTNGSALFSSARSSGLATLSALPFEDSDDVTVEFFVCTTAKISDYSFLVMSGETYGMPGSLSCYGEPSRNNLVADLYDSGARFDSENMSDNTLNDGNWHHVAILVDSSKTGQNSDRFQLYVDRVRQAGRNMNCLDSALFNRILYIGQRGTQGRNYFDGRLDDIRVTGRLLSTSEFLAATDRTASCGCVAYWPFKEGREMEDASGNGNSLVNDRVTFYAGSAVFDQVLPSHLVTSSEVPFSDLVDVTIEYFVRTTYVPPSGAFSFILQTGPIYGEPGTFASYVNFFNKMENDVIQSPWSAFNQERAPEGLLTDGQWHHIAIVMEKSASKTNTTDWFRLYVDHVRRMDDGRIFTSTQPVLYSNRLYIGARGSQNFDFFSGRLDDIKITGAALSPSDFMTRRTFYEGTTLTIR